ncbi:putative endonuclease V [Actinoplanes missouriensis 431]|uniref:Endonuclease V n=1 Tax=Actinoplanes missouriensis (strain ATCC 14538 / DSM 43046 / CBS 188.64 / JCM 3121 / NBRC 102363 / NCIMB 12654 / NRRL B-3342 / UNCC 431) TaxID=512565 RepID=I0GZ97_ACTM4|nr:deoxyribonuclease V [Actinoplanes missouriensis]BAL86084.1 putative endonuclease V [Actinoplanes missouriensis 431]
MRTWPRTPEEALATQEVLRSRLISAPGPAEIDTVAGLDVAYDGDRLGAAVVVLDYADLSVRDTAVVLGRPAFPYVPGLFAFREVPALLEALEKLTVRPDVLICDGHGVAHPRRFGLAAHLGVLTDLPAFGVGKTRLVGEFAPVGEERGDRSPLIDAGETVGAVLRTRARVKPVFVSAGHRMDLDSACRMTLRLTPEYRLPETTRAADRACRDLLLRPSGAGRPGTLSPKGTH